MNQRPEEDAIEAVSSADESCDTSSDPDIQNQVSDMIQETSASTFARLPGPTAWRRY